MDTIITQVQKEPSEAQLPLQPTAKNTPLPPSPSSGLRKPKVKVKKGQQSHCLIRFCRRICFCFKRQNRRVKVVKARPKDSNDDNSWIKSSQPSTSATTAESVIQSNPTVYLLPALPPTLTEHKIVMVLDLDETLVHSTFDVVQDAPFIVDIELQNTLHKVYVRKRPYVDEFLQRMASLYEIVLFTASLPTYGVPVTNWLDQWGVFSARLYRESCLFENGIYIKDLSQLGRDLKRTIIVDNNPVCYYYHPDNAVPVKSWFDDASDTELESLVPFFERLSTTDNVYTVLRNSNHPFDSSIGSRDRTRIIIDQKSSTQRAKSAKTTSLFWENEAHGAGAMKKTTKLK